MRRGYPPLPRFPIEPIIEYFGGTVRQRRGSYATLCCPFHDDKNPSARLIFKAQRFECFACGIYQDGIGLLREVEGYSFQDAVAQAEDITGVRRDGVRPERRTLSSLFE